jgi:hypothetical protein
MKIAYCPHCKNPIIVADQDWGRTVECDAPRCRPGLGPVPVRSRWGRNGGLVLGLAMLGVAGWRVWSQDNLLAQVAERLTESGRLLRRGQPHPAGSSLAEAEEILARLHEPTWLPLWQERRARLHQEASTLREQVGAAVLDRHPSISLRNPIPAFCPGACCWS